VVVAPPVAVVPGPAVVAPPSTVIVNPPTAVAVSPGFDPVADAVGRFKSWHENSRVDACVTLGRLRDPRALPALVDRLKNDSSKTVRVAAATAIGEIGDEQAAVVLERATIYEKRQEVRDAAAAALAKMKARPPATAAAAAPTPATAANMPAGRVRPPLPTPPPPAPPDVSTTPGLEPLPSVESVPPDPTPIRPDPNYRPNS
jgi:hypothetical protein